MKVWIIDEWNDSFFCLVHQLLQRTVEGLGVDLDIEYVKELRERRPGAGDVVVAFAAMDDSTRLPEAAPGWASDCSVITVVQEAEDVPRVRGYLQDQNAFVRSRYGDYWPEVLADAILSSALLERKAKSAFISYRRSDGTGVARQVAGRLAAEGFGVFLDERSLPIGERFEAEVAYQINDVDLIVLLATPELKHSPWIQREIALAAAGNIALVVVDCDHAPEALRHPVVLSAMADQRFRPHHIPRGKHDTLADDDLSTLIAMIYRLRVGVIVRRIWNLLPAARERYCFAGQPGGPRTWGERQAVVAPGAFRDSCSGAVIQPLPFRPTIDVVWRLLARHGGSLPIRIAYRETVPNDGRVFALQWAFGPHQPELEIVNV